MNSSFTAKTFCFCTLALGKKYQLLARELALGLKRYAPKAKIVVGTDNPKQFKNCENVISFQQKQTGVLHCYNDKRFVIEKCLLNADAAIYLDADTKIISEIDISVEILGGIRGFSENLLYHVSKYRPEDLEKFQKLSSKLKIPIEEVDWIGDSLFIVAKDGGKEKEFLEIWGLIARYLELKGIHSGQGNVMGLAATKVGWKVRNSDSLRAIARATKHLDASHDVKKSVFGKGCRKNPPIIID